MKGGNEKMENPNLEDKIRVCIDLIGKDKLDEVKVKKYIELRNELKELYESSWAKRMEIDKANTEYLKNVIFPRTDRRYTLDEARKLQGFGKARDALDRDYSMEKEQLEKKLNELNQPIERVIEEYYCRKHKLKEEYIWKLEEIDMQIKNEELRVKGLKSERENADKAYKENLEKVDNAINALDELEP